MLDQFVKCDGCGKGFATNTNVFAKRNGDIETVGLRCPHCEKQFVAYRTNSAIRNLQAKVQREIIKFRQKIAAGVVPNRAERKLKLAKRQLEAAFKVLNGAN